MFREEERIRLALRDSLRQQQVQGALGSEHVRDQNKEAVQIKVEDADEESVSFVRKQTASVIEDQSLLNSLPNSLVLDDILGSFVDLDTLFMVLPRVSKEWKHAINGVHSGSLLWKKLCMRAWEPLHLPMKLAATTVNDWQERFYRRPIVRLSGPYVTFTIFIQHPGPRNMWTPKDAPSVKVIYHYRFWWFLPNGRVMYTALATRSPEHIIHLMRKELLNPATIYSNSQSVSSGETVFWFGRYVLMREGGVSLCEVDVPHARHSVLFRFEMSPSGENMKILRHQSYRFKTPYDIMNHTLPECEEDRLFHYWPGFL